jgi:hypothetical protein
VTSNPFFEPGNYDREFDRLGRILDQADAVGLRYRIGLLHDQGWWDKVKNEPELVAVYLRRLLLEQRRVIGPLVKEAGNRSGCTGFYIPQELDDRTWLAEDMRRLIIDYLGGVAAALRSDGPGFSVAVSGFSNGHSDPGGYSLLVGSIVKGAGLDRFYFQDGVGSGKLDLEESLLYLRAAHQGTMAAGAVLDVVVEVFEAATQGNGFSAVPAGMERIAAQLNNASTAAGAGITAFSVPDYMSPGAGPGAERLRRSYEDYLTGAPVAR